MMVILECQVLELWIGMNVFDCSTFLALLKQQRERPENFRLEWRFNTPNA